MFKALMKVRFAATLYSLSGASKTKKSPTVGRMALQVVLFAYLIGVFGFVFYQLFAAIAPAFYQIGAGWFYFTMFSMVSFAVMFIFSVFTAKSQLFEAKDNELLLAMPIPPGTILASRLASLYLLNFVTGLIVAVPAAIVWFGLFASSAAQVLAFVLLCLLLPLLSTAVAAFFGWILALITSRVRKKTLVNTILSLAFLAVYFYGYSKINTGVTALIASGEAIAGQFHAVAPLYWLGASCADGSAKYMLLSVLCLVVPFIVAWLILAATFIRTATTKRGAKHIEYHAREQKVATASSALFRRDMARFFSSSIYIMNSGLGAMFLVIAGVALVIKSGDVLKYAAMLTGFENYIMPALLLFLCAFGGTILVTAPSISLEGSSLWIIKSLPVSAWQALRSKVLVHLAIACPAMLIAQIAVIAVFRPSGLMLLAAIVLPQVFNVYTALFGLTANLCHPNFTWTNEAQPVKSGVNTLLAMLANFSALLVGFLLGILLISSEGAAVAVTLGFTVLVAAACYVDYKWLKTRGAVRFAKL